MPSRLLCQRTRLAPTPSGYLHAGNLFSFLLTDALARRSGARLLLRIDDLDQPRFREAYLRDIFDSLRFFGINWQEGPADPAGFNNQFSQMLRRPLYESFLLRLREKKLVYACRCSRSQLARYPVDAGYPGTCRHLNIPLDEPGVSWRLRCNPSEQLELNSLEQGPMKCSLPASMQDFVVRKKDGLPSYQLASLADDLHFGVDLIVRGSDLWPSTLAQLYLARLLGEEKFAAIRFFHHPLLLGSEGEKLSKSAGAGSLFQLRQQGVPLQDILDLLAAQSGLAGGYSNAALLGDALLEKYG